MTDKRHSKLGAVIKTDLLICQGFYPAVRDQRLFQPIDGFQLLLQQRHALADPAFQPVDFLLPLHLRIFQKYGNHTDVNGRNTDPEEQIQSPEYTFWSHITLSPAVSS